MTTVRKGYTRPVDFKHGRVDMSHGSGVWIGHVRRADPAESFKLPVSLAYEAARPLSDYRAAELGLMHRNFYGFDPSYHIVRSNFVRRVPPS